MVSHKQIVQFSNSIAKLYQPERIILFGSRAYGTPEPDSDVDLLVIMPFEGHHVYKAAEILGQTRPQFPVDLLVRTPDHVQQQLELRVVHNNAHPKCSLPVPLQACTLCSGLQSYLG